VLELLSNPVIDEQRKKELVKRLAAEASFSQYTVNFLSLLIDQSRIEALEQICESFEKSYCQLTDTQVATLRSAVKLEQEQQFLIAKKLQELTGSKNIKLKPVVDADLVAGFVVEYGSTRIDLSGAHTHATHACTHTHRLCTHNPLPLPRFPTASSRKRLPVLGRALPAAAGLGPGLQARLWRRPPKGPHLPCIRLLCRSLTACSLPPAAPPPCRSQGPAGEDQRRADGHCPGDVRRRRLPRGRPPRPHLPL
jgi:F-type H+-transporting ATPase subunit delta